MPENPRRRRLARRALPPILLLVAFAAVPGCYYAQAVRGQFDVLKRRTPVEEVIADPATDPALAARLATLADARDFATRELMLPDNGSYRSYADLERDYVVWNVIAAPEFSLEAKTWCYLFVGCLAYRGYFDEAGARRTAARLRDDGYDVYVGGVAAYSTLGRFADPILNTMLSRDDAELVALLFHELAHQRLYLDDDTAFNESFATAVAEIGLARWLEARGEPAVAAEWSERQRRAAARLELIDETRERLRALYAQPLPAATLRERKAEAFAALERALDARGEGNWPGELFNNAWLASVALYRGNVPAFRALYADCGRELGCFYAEVEKLGELGAAERADRLAALAPEGDPG